VVSATEPVPGSTGAGAGAATDAVAVVCVRSGALPAGTLDAVAAAGGRVVLVGSGTAVAAEMLGGAAVEVSCWEAAGFAPGRWAGPLAELVSGCDQVVLPGSPDGRDLAPRLAAVLDRPLVCGVVEHGPGRLTVSAWGGSVMVDVPVAGPVVWTVHPVAVTAEAHLHGTGPVPVPVTAEPTEAHDAVTVEVLGPDLATMDLAEAPRLVGGGAGLDGPERFELLAAVAARLGAAMGATRVVTDRGWLSHDRQIGTTGVVVDPALYLAFGISGAVQHTAGLGDPDHIISVNTEPHCPMMSMADVAIVADANETVAELARMLGCVDGAERSGAVS